MQIHVRTRWLASLAAALCLAACGGGGGSSPPPTVTAQDDQYTIPGGAAATLAVSGNDTATGGTPTLSVATAPAHGKVVVQGTSLQYTPDAGFFGADQFTYRADVGAATGTATVKLTVEAQLELTGTVPGINSLTEVTAQVGESQIKVNADSTGAYKLSFKADNPNAFITLTAKESGARAALTRISLVGQATSLISQVGPRVSDKQWPALTLDALSTARYGLLKQRGLQQPTTTDDLRKVVAAQDPTDLADIATLLRLAYEKAPPMPFGIATAAELAADGPALGRISTESLGLAFIEPTFVAQSLEQSTDAEPPVVSAQGTRLVTMYQGSNPLLMPTGSLFDLRPDGSAAGILWTTFTDTAISASWAMSGSILTITLPSPLAMDSKFRAHALQLRQFRSVGTQPSGMLMGRWLVDCQMTPTQPASNCSTPTYTPWVPMVSRDVDRDRQDLRLADFTVGTVWAGLTLETVPGNASCVCFVKAVTFDGTPNVPGFTGQFINGRWQLAGAQVTLRYTRLGAGPEEGMEYWLAEVLETGVTARARLMLVVKGGAVPIFDAASAARRWISPQQDANASADPTGLRNTRYPTILHKDGRMANDWGNGEVDAGARWSLSSDRRTIMQTRTSDGAQFVLYTPIRAVQGGYIAMTDGNGMVRIHDAGPAD